MFLRASFLSLLLCVLLQVACSRPNNTSVSQGSASPSPAKLPGATSVNFVTAGIAKIEVRAGDSTEATVTLHVKPGYHVNANPATDTYLKATELVPQPANGFTVGYVKYPNALHKKFAFSDKELAVYEGDVLVKVLLKVDKSATKVDHSIPAKLNIQACDNEVCYAPGTLELSIPVLVN